MSERRRLRGLLWDLRVEAECWWSGHRPRTEYAGDHNLRVTACSWCGKYTGYSKDFR